MNREDSGVIDLFAIHERAKAAPSQERPRDLFSTPPPAFTTDLYSDPALHLGDDDDPDDPENPFANSKKKSKRLMLGGAGAALLVVVVVMIAAFSGGGADQGKASAAAKSESAAASPAPTVLAVVAPPPMSAAASNTPTPPPPTTGAPVTQKPVPRGGRSALPGAPAKARAAAASGPKLTKIQSGGVATK